MSSAFKKPWIVGIDPGYTMTGVVVINPERKVESWAAFSLKPAGAEHARAMRMSSGIALWLFSKLSHLDDEIWFSMEMPVYTHNPQTFIKQVRLVQAIESRLLFTVGLSESKFVYLAEVQPSASKRIATGKGNADKADMVLASPFANLDPGITWDIREALADAWAHGMAAEEATTKSWRLDVPSGGTLLPVAQGGCIV